MKVQAISVCVNYSDFFTWSAINNKNLFDKWIIVTDTKDSKTKMVCEYHGIFCLQTDIFYKNAIFNKYAGIVEALNYVDDDAFILFLDSDIILPPLTKRAFEQLEFRKDTLYGIDRLNCKGIAKWVDFCNKPNLIIGNWLLTDAGGMQFGSRINHYYGQQGENGRFSGWKPLGFFQLAHRSAFDTYPSNSQGADHCDILFANKFSRSKRVHIPEIMGIHLESDDNGKGVNWYGRKSAAFLFPESTIKIEKKAPDQSIWDLLKNYIRKQLY